MSEEILEEIVTEESAVEQSVKKARKPRTKSIEDVVEEVVETKNIVVAEETTTDEGQVVVTAPKKQRAPRKSNTKVNDDGVIGSNAADYALKDAPKPSAEKPKEQVNPEKVALWSAKNIRWTGIGELSKGYNIVTKEAAEKWLTKAGIREATPKEIATYYGK